VKFDIKAVQQAFPASPRMAKAIEWGRLFAFTGATQAVVQAAAFVGGIIVIRFLPTEQYALYILANSMIGTMTVLADGGITTGVTAHSAKVWNDPIKLGTVLSSGLFLRRKFASFSIVVTIPVIVYLFRMHNAGWFTILFLVVGILMSFLFTLSGSLLQIAPRLRQDISSLQRNQVEASAIRIILLLISFILFPLAFIAIAATALPQYYANVKLRRICSLYADWTQPVDKEVVRGILVFVKKLLPGAIYYCLSGQLTIWLISVFGSTSAVAHVGALTRLSVVLSLFNIVFHTLIVPRFARLTQNKRLLMDRYVKVQLYLLGAAILALTTVWIFPTQILWVLGDQYKGLEFELLLTIAGSCLNLIVGINYSLNASRGWLINPVLGILVGIGGIISGIMIFDISTLIGVLWFNIWTGVVGLFVHPLFGLVKIIRLKPQRDTPV
jgi:O-antigen/teichoic acid export membrane protein